MVQNTAHDRYTQENDNELIRIITCCVLHAKPHHYIPYIRGGSPLQGKRKEIGSGGVDEYISRITLLPT